MKKTKLLAVLSLFGLLASCAQAETKGASISIANEARSTSNVYSSNEVTLEHSLYSIQDDYLFGFKYLPSIGERKVLVVPVLVPGYTEIDIDGDGVSDNARVQDDLDTAFFGGNKIGYESVSSFYSKSSFGKLNLTGEVTPWFDVGSVSSLGISTVEDITSDKTYEIAEAAVKYVKEETSIDITDYDTDGDGFVDALWLIYSCPDYRHDGPVTDDYNFWAYTAWGNQSISVSPSKYDPIYSLFGWASYNFMYERYGVDRIDAHTYIHETGHFLGLKDYYSDSATYNPIGNVDMMDGNIIDHNVYSKMLLGWIKPTVVYGSANLSLSFMDEENACIVIPSDQATPSNVFDPFGEYVVLELYRNQGLSYADSLVSFENMPKAVDGVGVRIYHVNNPLYLVDFNDSSNPIISLYEGGKVNDGFGLVLPISNNRNYDTYNYYFGLSLETNLYDEIRLIEANGTNTFSYGGFQKNNSFFREGDSFSLKDYGEEFFLNVNKLDNGESFSSVISIGGIKA